MFTPTKDEVRRFFRQTWRKHCESQILTPLEMMALDWIIEHPEYHGVLDASMNIPTRCHKPSAILRTAGQ